MKTIDLLKDPVYRTYFLKAPRFPYPLAYETPWTVWINRESSRKPGTLIWSSYKAKTFKEAFIYCKPRMKQWEDFSICSTVIGFVPPKKVRNAYELSDWCSRCRRPVELRTFRRHHALDSDVHQYFEEWPICPFCGCSGDLQMTMVPG